jgi:glutamate carboxypeptidase
MSPVRALPTALLLACLCATPVAAAKGLSPVEKKIVASVDKHAPASLELLERAVNINSGTMNADGVRQVRDLFRPQFEALGFTTKWVDGSPWGRAGHLIARRERSGGRPKVLLIGHLDTVFEKDSPFQRFQRLDDSTASGPGVSDMKGGDVVMLLALRALADAGVLDRLSIVAVLSGDEEKVGEPQSLSRRDLIEAADWADVAIGFEDGPGDPTKGVVARRGSSSWELRVSGKTAHSSQIFQSEVGDGAVFETARILEAFRDSLSAEPLLTFNPGVIVGGTTASLDWDTDRGTAFGKGNVIAESCYVAGDLRAISLAQRETTKARMRNIVAAHLPHTGATIEFEDGYPPLAPTDGNRRLLAAFDRASRDLGFGPVSESDPRKAGAADISFADGRVDMALDGVGLMGPGGHTVEEKGDLRTMPMNGKRVAVLLWRLSAPAP